MRKQDIKPGVVYAYCESRWNQPSPVVFLAAPAASRIYTRSARRGEDGQPFFTTAREGVKAGRYSGGYPMVRLAHPDNIGDISRFTLDGFEAATDPRADGGTYTIVSNLVYIVGPYDEVMADRDGRPRAVSVFGSGDYDDPVEGCRYELSWSAPAGGGVPEVKDSTEGEAEQ